MTCPHGMISNTKTVGHDARIRTNYLMDFVQIIITSSLCVNIFCYSLYILLLSFHFDGNKIKH